MIKRHALYLAACGAALAAAPAIAADSPKAIVEKAVEAYGGKDKLNKYPAGRMEFKGSLQLMGVDVEFTGRSAYHIPDRERNEMVLDVQGQKVTVIHVVNGNKVKVLANGEEAPASDAMKQEMKESAALLSLYQITPLLDGKQFELKAVENPDKVNGKETAAVAVTAKNLREVKLYFDKKSGLIVKMERKGLSPEEKEGKQEIYFSAHKKFNDLLTPVKWEMHFDGKKMLEMELTQMEYAEKVDEKEFDVSD